MQTNFILHSNNWIYDNKLDTFYLSDQADNLLIEAGWNYVNNRWIDSLGRVLSFSITVDSGKEDRVIAGNVIASQLANHGISVFVKEEANNNFVNDFNNRNYEVMIIGLQTGFSPRVNALFDEGNLANYSNENVKAILNDIKNTSDYIIQKENYSKLYDEYINDFPYIFLYRSTSSVVYNQTLCGKISPNSYSIFYNIEKWYRQ